MDEDEDVCIDIHVVLQHKFALESRDEPRNECSLRSRLHVIRM